MIKVFTKNKQGKIEFTESELKKLLDEVYQDGYQNGKGQNVYWYSPPWWYNHHDWTWYSPYYTTTVSTPINETISGSSISNTINSSDYTTSTQATVDASMYKTALDGNAS